VERSFWLTTLAVFYERSSVSLLIALGHRLGWPDGAAIMTMLGMTSWLGRLARRVRARGAVPRAASSRQAEQRYREALEDLPVGVLLQGPCGEIQFCNRAALDLLSRAWRPTAASTS
jgi:PAS domain-containing protein